MLIFKITFWTIVNIISLFSALLHVIGWLRKIEGIKSSMTVTISLFFLGSAALFADLAELLNHPLLFKYGIVAKQFLTGTLCFSLITFAQTVVQNKSHNTLLNFGKKSVIPLLLLVIIYGFTSNVTIYTIIIILSSLLLIICTGTLILSKHRKNIPDEISKIVFIIPIFITILIPGFILENLKIHVPSINNFLPQGHLFLPLIILFRNGILFLINFKVLSKVSTDIPLNDIFASILTPKEKEITTLFLIGKTYKEIGLKLKISPNTVGSHINNIYDKTGTSNRMELFSHLTDEN